MDKLNIRCRGRNGFFAYDNTTCSHVTDFESNEPRVYLEINSKREGRSAPIQFYGHPEDVKALLMDALNKVDPVETEVIEQAENASNDPVRFAVFLYGGLVQKVYTDRPAQIIKIDMDIEGADEDEISKYPTRNNDTAEGCIYVNDSRDYPHCIIEEDTEYVERLFKSQED